jgi:endonuclease VIII
VPEGDTIHRLAQSITAALGGSEIRQFQTNEPHMMRDDIVGRSIKGATAEGKHLFIELSGGLILRSHLQMLGSWKVERPARTDALDRAGGYVHGEYRPAQLRLITERVSVVGCHLRILKWSNARSVERVVETLGPDLLAPDFSELDALGNLRRVGDMPIATALLRQDLVAGIGNVFKSEVLFLERIHPFVPVSRLDDEALLRLLRKSRQLMRRNLKSGPRTTRFALGGPRLWVYGRNAEPCLRCGEKIAMQRLGPQLRSTYYCPVCQIVGVLSVASNASG